MSEDLPAGRDHPARLDRGADGERSRREHIALQYNTAIPHLIGNFLPEGMLGVAVTGLLAAFMAGAAANVTAFNTVVTYDLIQAYFAEGRDAAYYLRMGRLVTIAGVLISVATAFIAKGYSNIMNYIQTIKAAGINIDLWSGLGMLVFGALMIFWALSRPVRPEPPEERGRGSGRIRRAPA